MTLRTFKSALSCEHLEAERRNKEAVAKIQIDMSTPQSICDSMAERARVEQELADRERIKQNLNPPLWQRIVFGAVWYGCIFAVFWFFIGRFLPTIYYAAYQHFLGSK